MTRYAMTFTVRDIVWSLVALVAAVLAWQLRAATAPQVAARATESVDTVYVSRETPEHVSNASRSKPPGSPAAGAPPAPTERILYRTVRDTVRIEVPVPRLFDGQDLSVTLSDPIRLQPPAWHDFSGRARVILTRYDVGARRYVEDIYQVEPPAWALSPYIEAAVAPSGLAAAAGLRLRWKRVEVFGGYGATGETTGGTVGLRVYPFTLRR